MIMMMKMMMSIVPSTLSHDNLPLSAPLPLRPTFSWTVVTTIFVSPTSSSLPACKTDMATPSYLNRLNQRNYVCYSSHNEQSLHWSCSHYSSIYHVVCVCAYMNKPALYSVSSCTISPWQHYTNILSPSTDWHTHTLSHTYTHTVGSRVLHSMQLSGLHQEFNHKNYKLNFTKNTREDATAAKCFIFCVH